MDAIRAREGVSMTDDPVAHREAFEVHAAVGVYLLHERRHIHPTICCTQKNSQRTSRSIVPAEEVKLVKLVKLRRCGTREGGSCAQDSPVMKNSLSLYSGKESKNFSSAP